MPIRFAPCPHREAKLPNSRKNASGAFPRHDFSFGVADLCAGGDKILNMDLHRSDHELLHSYRRFGAEPDFAELVRRHMNLVYSAALQQVRSRDLAEDVVQSVFCDLARNAGRISAKVPVAAWLHVVTRRTAVDLIRREARRTAREQDAAGIAAMKPTPDNWNAIEPLLDEAIGSLPAADRNAVLLRFFEQKSLREVGEALGSSENAAQKRVNRALEQLRVYFLRRGIAASAAGLATDLSAHAVETAPAYLVAKTAAAATVVSVGSKASGIAIMSSINKLLVSGVAVVLGVAVFESVAIAHQRNVIESTRRKADAALTESRFFRGQYEAATRALALFSQPNGTPELPSPEEQKLADEITAWLARVQRVRGAFAERPELAIPELGVLLDSEWFMLAQDVRLGDEEQIRDALARIREIAESRMGSRISAAMSSYARANGGMLPPQTADLIPFFREPIDPVWLARYKVVRTGKVSELPRRDRTAITTDRPADPERDLIWRIGPNQTRADRAADVAVRHAQAEYARTHGGNGTTDPGDLMPLLSWPLSPATVQQFLSRQDQPR